MDGSSRVLFEIKNQVIICGCTEIQYLKGCEYAHKTCQKLRDKGLGNLL